MKTVKVFLFSLAIITPGFLLAHPPKDIKIAYDTTKGIISLNIIHPVADVKSHYIKEVIIWVDDKEIKKIELTEQTSLEAEVLTDSLPGVKAGSVIKVRAYCSRFGRDTEEITVK